MQKQWCWLTQDCCSLVLYSREELDQIEWDLLFSLNHHLSIKKSYFYVFILPALTEQVSCFALKCSHIHFSLSTLMVLTWFAHILIFLDCHIQILNLKRPPTFLGLLWLLWLPGPELDSLVRYSCSDQGVLEAIKDSEFAVNWAGKPNSIRRIFKGVRGRQNLQKRFYLWSFSEGWRP